MILLRAGAAGIAVRRSFEWRSGARRVSDPTGNLGKIQPAHSGQAHHEKIRAAA